jgi:hypothetical protein
MYLNTEAKKEIFAKHGGSENEYRFCRRADRVVLIQNFALDRALEKEPSRLRDTTCTSAVGR